MTTIKITPSFAGELQAIRDLNKTPWLIISEDFAVGCYVSRAHAREAKARDGLDGQIVKSDEVSFEVVDLAAAAQALHNDETQKSAAPVGKELTEDIYAYRCPHCDIPLDNGVGMHDDAVNGKRVKHEKYVWACLACGGEFGPALQSSPEKVLKASRHANLNKSSAEHPCKLVWHIADEMLAANPNVKRKDVLAKCVEKGIAFYTARTQYQQWLGVRKEMAEREAKQAAAK